MAEVKWIKIVTDMFDDEKILLIETLPEGDSILVIWLKLLCLAGKQNNSGVFAMQNGMPYTDKMLSIIFRRKEPTVQLALNTFQAFGMIEIIKDTITIPNWGKHQNFDKIERNNEYMKNYMREYRGRQKQIASGNGEAKCKPNVNGLRKTNVSALDKSRIEKKRKEIIEEVEIPPELNTPNFLETWEQWKKYRKEIKKAMKPSTEKMQLNRFIKEGVDRSIEAMTLSMESGWTGFVWDKLKTKPNSEEHDPIAELKERFKYTEL